MGVSSVVANCRAYVVRISHLASHGQSGSCEPGLAHLTYLDQIRRLDVQGQVWSLTFNLDLPEQMLAR